MEVAVATEVGVPAAHSRRAAPRARLGLLVHGERDRRGCAGALALRTDRPRAGEQAHHAPTGAARGGTGLAEPALNQTPNFPYNDCK